MAGVEIANMSRFVAYTPPTSAPVRSPASATSLGASFTRGTPDLAATQRSLIRAQDAIKELAELLQGRRGGSTAGVVSLASDVVGAGQGLTAATVRSTSEINTIPTSYSPRSPNWALGSSSAPTISGIYGGTTDQTLTFKSRDNGVVGLGSITIEVHDGGGTRTDSFKMTSSTPAGTKFALSSGLIVSFGSGSVVKNDTFDVLVKATVGSAVDPTKPFNGTGNQNPGFEPGVSVTAGAFSVNGVGISVAASDSINSVLDRITQSAAGVTASFDAASERVVLTQKTTGVESGIALGGDTSGFLAAVRLSGATVTPGTSASADDPLANLTRFAGVSAGSFSINGVAIALDPNVDSLNALVARIDGAGAGVAATYDAGSDRVMLTTRLKGDDLTLADGGTGILAALGLPSGTTEAPKGSGRGYSRSRVAQIGDTYAKLVGELNALFDDKRLTDGTPSRLTRLRGELRAAAADHFDSGKQQHRTSFGVELDFRSGDHRVALFGAAQRGRFEGELSSGSSKPLDVLFGRSGDSEDGLLDKFASVISAARKDLSADVGTTGVLINAVG